MQGQSLSSRLWKIGILTLALMGANHAYCEPAEAEKLKEAKRIADAKHLEKSNKKMRELADKRAAQMAQDSMDPATRAAWDRYNSGGYSGDAAGRAAKDKDFLRLQRDWDQVQAEAHKGNISVDENSRFLVDHSANVKQRMIDAGEKNNLGVSLQDSSGEQKTYSDVDGHGRPVYRNDDKSVGKAGEMSAQQFEQARTDFNDQFNKELKAAGLEPLDNPSKRMRSDIMPITEDKTLFRAVEGHINPDGGVMYQDPRAVDQEVKNRQKNPDGSLVGDTTDAKTKTAYAQEQIRQQRGHAIESQHMMNEAHEILNNPKSTDVDKRRANRLLEQAQEKKMKNFAYRPKEFPCVELALCGQTQTFQPHA